MNFTISFYAKTFSFLLLTMLTVSVVFGQEPLQPGYIISLQGDSIHGLLDMRGKASNALMIRFRASQEKNEVKYSPEDILGYGILTGDFFESHLVKINESPYKVGDLTDIPEPTIGEGKYFLQAYVKGLISMFAFQDDNDNLHIFLQKGEKSPEPLINYRYLKKEWNGSRTVNRIKEQKKYLSQLANLMSDCDEINQEFLFQKQNGLKWRVADIQALVIRYNERMGAPSEWYIEDVKKRSQPHIDFGFLMGPALSKIYFKAAEGVTKQAHNTAYFPMGASFSGGLFLHLQSKGNQGRWGFQAELIRHRIKAESDVTVVKGEAEHYRYKMNVDLTYLRLGTAVRYNLPTSSSFKPFGLLGLSNGFLTHETNTLATTSFRYGVHNYTVEPIFSEDELLTYELGTMVGLGVAKAPFIIEAKYDYTYRGFSPIIGVGTPRHNVYVLLGLFF